MSKASEVMERLLQGERVEWVSINDIFILRNGYTPSRSKKEYWANGTIPWFRMEDIRSNGSILDDAIQHVHESGVKGKLFPANSIIMATTATVGVHALITTPYLCNQQLTNFSLKEEYKQLLSIKFVYYYFYLICERAKQSVNLSSFPSVRMTELRRWEFPIPPLHVQEKIVSILDTFTELTKELTKEQVARQTQYEYYRDKLLTFEDGEVEWIELGEVGEFIRGSGLQKRDFIETGFPAIHYGQIHTHFGLSSNQVISYVSDDLAQKLRKAKKNDLLLATTSEDDDYVAKPLAWLGDDVAISGDMMLFRHNEDVKYLAYYFQTNHFRLQKQKHITGAKVRRISQRNLGRIIAPIPPLHVQQEIVDKLDRFNALANSITEGLPREIELRQKQYEYYRDLLLDFPKAA